MGHRPLLMDSEDEEEEEKHSSGRTMSRPKQSTATRAQATGAAAGGGGGPEVPAQHSWCPPGATRTVGRGLPDPEFDVFGAVPFFAARAPAAPTGAEGPLSRRAGFPPRDSSRRVSMSSPRRPSARRWWRAMRHAAPAGPPSVDVFGSTPFPPFPPSASKRVWGTFGLVPFEGDNWGSRQRSAAQPTETVTPGRAHQAGHGQEQREAAPRHDWRQKPASPPSAPPAGPAGIGWAAGLWGSNLGSWPSQTPRRTSAWPWLMEGPQTCVCKPARSIGPLRQKAQLPPGPALALPHQGLSADHNPVLPEAPAEFTARLLPRGKALKMDDFGAVPFTELVVQGIHLPSAPTAPARRIRHPFGAAPVSF